jgi:hypothetical protein
MLSIRHGRNEDKVFFLTITTKIRLVIDEMISTGPVSGALFVFSFPVFCWFADSSSRSWGWVQSTSRPMRSLGNRARLLGSRVRLRDPPGSQRRVELCRWGSLLCDCAHVTTRLLVLRSIFFVSLRVL